ncbi:hypothetical protein V5735_03420 (plasmid) [Haladaptatus sp. SPP-AMP-3]|uniref:hypothetical protein n=1 Tax=Haladaptatus sp. SPP-AMP-3 TaxID=3121295 RepID=UPI003C2F6944
MNPRGEIPEWQRRLKEDVGENPARFLDHALVEYGASHTDETIQSLVVARIRGICYLEVVNAWIAVERKLDRGPRDNIISLLEERKAYLEENGERELPSFTREELRERARKRYERASRTEETAGDEDQLTAIEKLHRLRAEGGASQ